MGPRGPLFAPPGRGVWGRGPSTGGKGGESRMLNVFFYISTILIWGSTWLAIKFQLTGVPPILSVGYRFLLAAAILFLYCLIRRRNLKFPLIDHLFMAGQGFFLFGLGYCLTYFSSGYLTSGLVSVIFSIMLLLNILNLRLFMGQPVAWRALKGGVLGLVGLGLIFWPDLKEFRANESLIGLGLGLVGTYAGSLGNVISSRNAKRGLPVTQCNAFGMAYGGALTFVFGWLHNGSLVFDFSLGYLSSLLYLALFGSVAAFGAYITLIGRIGAEFAAYIILVTPVIALSLSTLFEGYVWSPFALAGVAVVMVGNLIILGPIKGRPSA